MGIYAVKPAFRRSLAGLAGTLVRRGVSADAVTTAGIVASGLGGGAILAGGRWSWWWLAVPACAFARIMANALDGLVAQQGGTARPAGELFNETADRLGDAAFLAPLAFVPGVNPGLALGALAAAELASFVGVTARAAGGSRRYDGPMGKPDRMAVVAVAAVVAAFVARADLVWTLTLCLIAAGGALTAANRYLRARRQLEAASRNGGRKP